MEQNFEFDIIETNTSIIQNLEEDKNKLEEKNNNLNETNNKLNETNNKLNETNNKLNDINDKLNDINNSLILKELKLSKDNKKLHEKLNKTIKELKELLKNNEIHGNIKDYIKDDTIVDKLSDSFDEMEYGITLEEELSETLYDIKNFFLDKVSKLQILYIDLQKEYLNMTKDDFINTQDKYNKSKDLYCPFPEEIKPLVFVKNLQNRKLNNTNVKLSGYRPRTNTYIIENTNINIKNKNFLYSPHMKN